MPADVLFATCTLTQHGDLEWNDVVLLSTALTETDISVADRGVTSNSLDATLSNNVRPTYLHII
jgi:hypothetical protein